MYIISLPSVQYLFTVLSCTSSRCPQHNIFQQCYNAHHLAVSVRHHSATTHIISLSQYSHLSSVLIHILAALSTASFISAITSSRCLSTASFINAIVHIISLPLVQHLSAVLSCPSYCCPQHSIVHHCYHAHHLAVLSTASFIRATMHIILLYQYGIFHQCNHAHHLTVSVRHLSAVQPCT